MSARLPLLAKTPFVLDGRPLLEATSPHAGALSISRAYRSLGVPQLVGANLHLRKRQRGFSEAQCIESLCLLQAVGGECPEDLRLLLGDECLERGPGWIIAPLCGCGIANAARVHEPRTMSSQSARGLDLR